MTRLQRAAAATSASLMFLALASTAREPRSREMEQSRSTNEMPMKMMHECMGHCQAMSGSMKKLKTTVEQARKSNDPAKMRAALDQVQTHMSGMDEQMNGCMQMMDRDGRGAMGHGDMDHERVDHESPRETEKQQ